jgi:biotin transport system substrate-specific component
MYLADAVGLRAFPRTDARLLAALQILAGSLAVAALAQVAIPLPWTPVPITGQTLGVLLVGAALGAKRGGAALLLYLAEGAAGLPFFAGGVGGAQVFLGPTGGYLIGFPLAAAAVGWLAERGWDRHVGSTALAMLIGTAIPFATGAAWLGVFVGFDRAVALGVVPFLPGAVIKIGVAAAALPLAWRWLGRPAG